MGELVYDGKWFTPLREALSVFTDDLQKTVTGDVKLKLYKGNLINAGVTSRSPCTMSRLLPSARMRITISLMQTALSTVWPAHC